MKLKMKSAGQLRRREKIKLEGDLFEVIDKLIAQGIEAGDIKKLEDAGIYTCKDLMMHTKKKLKGIKGLTEAKIEKIYEAAKKIVNSGYIITGSDALTKLPASSMREGNEKVANFDTEETFCSRPPKIIPAAESFGMDPGVVLDSSVHPSLPLPNLPSDLWESILLCARLPVRTLVQLTCSKRVWRDAVTSPIFVREYDLGEMGKTEKLVMKTQEQLSFCLFSTTTRNWTPITCPGELEGLTVVGSCRGLICLTEPVGLDLNAPMYLWNPSIRRIRQLPQGPVQVGEENSDIVPIVFGVGFDGSTYQYHVLKIWCRGFTPARNPAYQVEIYNVETNNWRRLPPLNEAFNDIPIWFESSYGFYKAGVLYWTLNRAHGAILSYNLASEIFAMEGFPVNLLQLEFPVTAAIHHRSISIALLNWGEQEEHCDVLVKLSVGDRGGYIWQHIWSLNPQRDFAVPRPLVCTPEAGYLMGYVHEVTHDRNLLLFNPDTNEEVEFPIELPLEEEDLYVDSYTESLQLF